MKAYHTTRTTVSALPGKQIPQLGIRGINARKWCGLEIKGCVLDQPSLTRSNPSSQSTERVR